MKMATNLTLHNYTDEDYIDMEISSSPKSRDFEFQMSFTSNKLEATADELFYQGKLLPLHHLSTGAGGGDHYYHSVPCTNTTNTPLDSCNISPSNSFRVSCELNPDDYFSEWSAELSSFINNHPTKKPWSKKLKLIKHSVFSQKLKASGAYLKSLFSKAVCNPEADQNLKIGKKISSCPKMETLVKNIDEDNVQRRSFSGAISSNSSSSSSSSFSINSSGLNELQFLRRTRSETEIAVSIDAAIAHCKNSQQLFCSRNLTKEEEEEEFERATAWNAESW